MPETFYKKVLQQLIKMKIPFMVGGTFAVRKYTGINRETKDVDVFCKPGDYPRILSAFKKNGFKIELLDEQWLAKIYDVRKAVYADVIFGSISGYMPVDETWLKNAKKTSLFGLKVRLIPPEELIWSKAFRQEREKYDGADVNHLILKRGKTLDWKRLLQRMEQYWEVLFSHLLNFRFVYPSERNVIPKWLMKELLNRLTHQLLLPSPGDKICRGTLLSKKQYNIDIKEWKFQGMSYKFNTS
jgi:predicted nucleotidyltransferase